MRTCVVLWAGMVGISVVSASTAAAQSLPGGNLDVGVSVGLFSDYPEQFAPLFCHQDAGGATGSVAYGLTSFLKVEGTATLTTGVGDEVCFFPAAPAPPDGGTFGRSVFEDEILGQSLFATNVGVLFEPLATSVVSPGLRVGVGRLWDKELGNWFYGGVLRLRLGSNTIVAAVERWNLEIDLRRETLIYRDSGAHELQSFQIVRQSRRPYLMSLGWERRVR
jgi:hypothetical protein